ncbi:hypothetical protein ACTU6V_13275 [Microbacterium sp. A204]|uniref:hypothetical protein n=1 Tax=Microbacterium sp. A204 TaxID=3457321 RepID=UPI003FCF4079
MKMNKTVSHTCGAIVLGIAVAVGAPLMASAAEHDATTADGVADVQIDFGTGAAERTATVLVLDANADPDAPTEANIAYVAEVPTDASGVASFRAVLPEGLDYWLASTVDGGERYVAMLDGSVPDDGSNGGGDGGGTGDNGTGTGTGSDQGGKNAPAADGDLATTGLAEWVLPAGLLAAGGLIAAGTALARRRRTHA